LSKIQTYLSTTFQKRGKFGSLAFAYRVCVLAGKRQCAKCVSADGFQIIKCGLD